MIKEVRFEIGCKNPKKLVDFYVTILGAKLLTPGENFFALELGGVKFALWKAEQDQEGIGLTFVPEDFSKTKEKLKEAKVIIEELDDSSMLLFEDPEQNNISLINPQAE